MTKKSKIPKARVNVSEYSYGRISKALRNAAKWINSNNRKFIYSEIDQYLPKSLYSRLSPDEADFIDSQTQARRDYFWEKLSLGERVVVYQNELLNLMNNLNK